MYYRLYYRELNLSGYCAHCFSLPKSLSKPFTVWNKWSIFLCVPHSSSARHNTFIILKRHIYWGLWKSRDKHHWHLCGSSFLSFTIYPTQIVSNAKKTVHKKFHDVNIDHSVNEIVRGPRVRLQNLSLSYENV